MHWTVASASSRVQIIGKISPIAPASSAGLHSARSGVGIRTSGAQSVLGERLGTLQDSVGRLSVGGQADVCVFHPDAAWTVQPQALRSQGKHTPFEGHTLNAAVRATVVCGHVAFEASAA